MHAKVRGGVFVAFARSLVNMRCGACRLERPPLEYSGAQRKKPAGQQRCKMCVESGKEIGSDTKQRCWGCNSEEGDTPFQKCGRCVELHLAPCYFCGHACLSEHWPRHRKWHHLQVQQEEGCKRWYEADSTNYCEPTVADRARRSDSLASGDPYRVALAKGLDYEEQGQLAKAAKKFRIAIELQPEMPSAYLNLAHCHARSSDFKKALSMYLQAADRYLHVDELWGVAISHAYLLMHTLGEDSSVPKPSWWSDVQLLKVSEEAVAVSPGNVKSWLMRAQVLGGGDHCLWSSGPVHRSPVHLREAAQCYLRLVQMPGTVECVGDASETCLKEAACCLRDAGSETLREAVQSGNRSTIAEAAPQILADLSQAVDLFQRCGHEDQATAVSAQLSQLGAIESFGYCV